LKYSKTRDQGFSKKIKEATNGTTDLIRTHEKEIAVITAN